MNKGRRKEIEKAMSLIEEASELLSTARDEEQDYYDNMPEGLAGGEKGDNAQACVSALESAISSLSDALSEAENSINQ